jgi:hypothetical protein
MTLDEIVADYIREYRPRGQVETRFFRSRVSLVEAISHAVRPRGRKHSHQYLIPPGLLDEAERRLVRSAPHLAKVGDFLDLHGVIEREIGPVRGIGELTVYDIVHRLGMYLRTAPELVYLHRGTKAGAGVLGFRGKVLDPHLLPSPFSCLTAAEIEDCLCICKHELSGGAARISPLTATHRCTPESQRAHSRC